MLIAFSSCSKYWLACEASPYILDRTFRYHVFMDYSSLRSASCSSTTRTHPPQFPCSVMCVSCSPAPIVTPYPVIQMYVVRPLLHLAAPLTLAFTCTFHTPFCSSSLDPDSARRFSASWHVCLLPWDSPAWIRQAAAPVVGGPDGLASRAVED